LFLRLRPLSRGALIDETALGGWLREKRIAGAGLDVFETEPLPAGHPLTGLPNILLTPHCGGMTSDSNLLGLAMAVENIESFLKGTPTHVVVGPGK
jgi:phosphoglycerate dehydrogenase-like enzyme